MSRFKKGDVVYAGRGEKMRKMIVDRVIDNHLLPIYQYTFEAPHNGFACGEQSIRATPDGPDLRLSECFKSDNSATYVNTVMSATRKSAMEDIPGLNDLMVFFRPDLKFCEWLRDYANGRLIIDVGAGQGHLVRMLKMVKANAIGIEPNFDKIKWLEWAMTRPNFDVNEMLEGTVEQYQRLIHSMGNSAMLVFARPCHGTFVANGIRNMPEGMEALYITLPENKEKYCNLGEFDAQAVLIHHDGRSEDNEVVYSVKK